MMTKGLFHRERVQELVVDVERAGQRIDNFLICKLKPVPRGHIYKILRRGEVRVNKGRIKPTYRLCEGDRIRIPPISGVGRGSSPHLPPKHMVERLRNAILYQDKGLIVINKPSGLAVHGGSGLAFGVIEIMRSLFPQFNLELVHRLDRETSGCLLIAKKTRVLRELHEMLRGEGIDKRYCALVKGRLSGGTHKVNAPLLKNILSSGERIVKVAPSGKRSLTLFKPLQHFHNATLVEVRPKTGRTHQIRVHANHIGQPIACDEKYGARDFNQATRELGLRRLFLHAQSLTFQLSDWQQPHTVEAPMEPNLSRCLSLLKNNK